MLSRFSRVRLFATLWAEALQSLSVGFSRQEYWSGLPFPLTGDLPEPGIEPASFMPPALAGGFFTASTTWKPRRGSLSYWSQSNCVKTQSSDVPSQRFLQLDELPTPEEGQVRGLQAVCSSCLPGQC